MRITQIHRPVRYKAEIEDGDKIIILDHSGTKREGIVTVHDIDVTVNFDGEFRTKHEEKDSE